VPEMDVLERQLTDLGQALEWPLAPNLAPRVREAIRPRRPWIESRWAIAAAAAIAILAALLAYPPSRDTIADWLNLRTRFQTLPQPVTTPSPLPAGPIGERIGLSGLTTLPAAQAAVKWQVLLPQSLGQPDEVYLEGPPTGPAYSEVTLVYGPRPGIPASAQTGVGVLVTEVLGRVTSDSFGKIVGEGTKIEAVSVSGHSGYWISGAPHIFYFIDETGAVRYETLRLATNTLIIDEGGAIVRIEGDLTKNQALKIAASLS
jgi:hypothetical protein